MDESKSNDDSPQRQRRFSREQYEMLKRCSDKKDMTEWNEWRKNNPNVDIELEDHDFSGWYLEGAYLYYSKTYNLFEGPRLDGEVYLRNSKFNSARLNNTRLDYAHLEHSSFYLANLKGADFGHAWLHGASLTLAIVDNSTIFWGPPSKKESKSGQVIETVDRGTNFTGVPLDGVRIDPGTKQLLEYNIRRKNWEDWYKQHPKLKWLVKPFWLISDYGLSAPRIINVFLFSAIAFAEIYYLWGLTTPHGVIDNLFADRNGAVVPWWIVPLRALYFSIITMTLGFSDMYANARSVWAHILITIQALLGYILLGALVTRFAVLFTAGGPAGKFADEKRQKATESTERHRENR